MMFNLQNRSTTPARVTEKILRLCRKISPNQQPIFVPVKPWRRACASLCFYNTRDKVAQDGGSVQYGWIIWETPGVLIEAEFHAIWISPQTEYIDITPKEDGERKILFLPDTSRVWEGVLVENIRMPLADNAYTRRLIKYSEEMFRLRKKYFRDGQSLMPYDEVLQVEEQFGLDSQGTNYMPVSRNAPCLCGSGRKYKKCHGK
jgi:SEC-C motif